MAQPLARGVPVVDATPAVYAVHQNHDYLHVGGGENAVWRGAAALRNQELAWASPFLCYTAHATWELTREGLGARHQQRQALAAAWEGAALLAQEDFSQALAKFEETLQLLPDILPGLQYVRALALAGLGRRDEALQALKAELAPHPTHHAARQLLDSLEGSRNKVRPLQPATAAAAGRPLISVVIPTHNRAAFVAEAVNSALAQEFRALEVVVVDDGSTDNTAEMLSQISDRRLRYVRKPKSNAPDTRNRGIEAARGEWLLWLDSDDLLLPGWLARLGSILEAGAGADVYYGNLEVVDMQGRRLQILRYEDFAEKNFQLLARLVHSNPLPLPGSLMRRALLAKVGGFDPEFTRAHDYEFWTRLAPVARFKHVPFLAVQWRWHDSNMSSGSVPRDLSFEARVAQLFPDLPWETDWPQAQTQAARQLGEIFSRYGDQESARQWQAESQELLSVPPPVTRHAAGL
jgi:GT2 family glycosyltransferase